MKREEREGDAVCHPLLVNHLEANLDYANEATTSSFKTFINGLNALSGVGILTVPYALASGGWLSLVLILTMAVAAFYTGLLMKRCMEADSTIKTYPDIGESAFGIMGRRVVSIFMCTELYLVTTGFLILEGDNLSNIFTGLKLETYGLTLGGRDTFIVLVALIILPSILLTNLNIVSYISATGVVASLVTVASVLWVGVFDEIGFSKKGELVNWSGIPTALSLYGFCYCAHPVFPNLYNSMKKKHHFSKVLLICILSSTITYTAMAILGYLMFGQNIKEQITLNLPTNKLSSKIAIWTTLINPLAKYGLMLEPVATSIETWFSDYRKERHYLRIFIRTALLTTQVLVAIFVPFFGPLMSLVGAFLSVTASITLPCLCYIKIDNGNIGIEKVIIVGNIVVSVFVAIVGTYTSLLQLIYTTGPCST